MLLNGGYETFDPRVDAIPFKDERSRNFPVTSELPTSPTLKTKHWLHGALTDQGREGACVGHGWTSYFTASPRRLKLAKPTSKTSEYAKDYYYECRRNDEWQGESYEGTSVNAGGKVALMRGLIPRYTWAFGTQQTLEALSHVGPVILGIPWYASMYDAPEGNVVIHGRLVGYHCITLTGINHRKEKVRWKNSWGPQYGVKGYAWLTFAQLDQLLQAEGEACVPVLP